MGPFPKLGNSCTDSTDLEQTLGSHGVIKPVATMPNYFEQMSNILEQNIDTENVSNLVIKTSHFLGQVSKTNDGVEHASNLLEQGLNNSDILGQFPGTTNVLERMLFGSTQTENDYYDGDSVEIISQSDTETNVDFQDASNLQAETTAFRQVQILSMPPALPEHLHSDTRISKSLQQGSESFGDNFVIQEDGNFNWCVVCGKKTYAQKLFPCDGCPLVFHGVCMPPSLSRSIRFLGALDKDKESLWFCPMCVALADEQKDTMEGSSILSIGQNLALQTKEREE